MCVGVCVYKHLDVCLSAFEAVHPSPFFFFGRNPKSLSKLNVCVHACVRAPVSELV